MNTHKLEKKLPSLLIDDATGGSDPLYQKKRKQISQLKRRQPTVFSSFIANFGIMLDELDKAAEHDGFLHIDFDEKGNIIRKSKRQY